MPTADTTSWTPCSEVAQQVCAWAEGKNVPTSGSLLVPETKGGETRWQLITMSENKREWGTTKGPFLSQ